MRFPFMDKAKAWAYAYYVRERKNEEGTRELHHGRVIVTALSGMLAVFFIGALIAGSRSGELWSVISTAVLIAITQNRRRRVRRATVIKASEQLTRWPWRAGRYIYELDQPAEWEGRQHPIVNLRWWAALIASPIIATIIGVGSHDALAGLIIWAATSAYPAWKTLEWYMAWMIITEDYVMLITGVFVWHGPAIRISRIEFVDPIDTPLGRLLGYRHLHFDTASPNDPFNDLFGVTSPRGTPPTETPLGLLLRHGASIKDKKRKS